MLEFIVNYWYLIVTAIAMVIVAISFVIDFIKKSPKERLECVKQWAVYACAMAEAHLGSNTGQMKMKETYDMFLAKFPSLAQQISYETYKNIAEQALLELKEMLKTNPNTQNVIDILKNDMGVVTNDQAKEEN